MPNWSRSAGRCEAGRIFGEIALFSPDQTRTQTVRAISDCTVLEIAGSTVKELFYQSPAFGFHLMELLAVRLGADVQRAERKSTPGEVVAVGSRRAGSGVREPHAIVPISSCAPRAALPRNANTLADSSLPRAWWNSARKSA